MVEVDGQRFVDITPFELRWERRRFANPEFIRMRDILPGRSIALKIDGFARVIEGDCEDDERLSNGIPTTVALSSDDDEGVILFDVNPLPGILCVRVGAIVVERKCHAAVGTLNRLQQVSKIAYGDDVFVVARHKDCKITERAIVRSFQPISIY